MKTKNLLKKAFLLLTLMGGANSVWASSVSDLTTISSNYTFIADNVTNNGTSGLSANTLYDSGRIFSPNGNSCATNKGSSTIDGVSHYNSLRIKSSSQDVLAFKVGGPCTMTIYAQTTGKTGTDARPIKVGNDINDDTYGTVTDVNEDHVINITAAGVVYLTGTGDRFIAGFKIIFPKPEITAQPVSAAYQKDDVATALTIAATASKGDLSYQWYSCDDANKTNAAAIDGATSASYTPATTANGTFYYFCRVTDDNGSTDSNVATITVAEATAPTISVDATATSVFPNTSVNLTATIGGIPEPTIQWYSCDDALKTNPVSIGGATNTTYSPSTATPGTYYFYAVATNSQGNATSDVITLTVINPYIVRTGYNTYYLAKKVQPVGGSSVLCDNITMVYDDVTLGTAGEDNMINSLNSKYVSSVSCSTNGWGVTFTPTANGVLSVGVIANKDKYINITNVSSFDYIDKDGNSGTYSGTTSDQLAEKFYGIVTFNVVSGTTYKVSVTGGSKMGLYGFEFAPSVSLNASGYATYSNAFAVEVSGAKAYTAELDFANETITCTEIASNKIPAGNGVLLYGEPGSTVTLTPTTGATALGTNNLKATTLADGSLATKGSNNYYALNGDTFKQFTGDAFVANKAYFEVTAGGEVQARSMRIVFAGDITGVANVEAAAEAKAKDGKFFKDGKLVIFKNGKKFNAAGAQVK